MAGAFAGEGGDLDTVVLISCRTITSCSRGGDPARVAQWVRAADAFYRRYGSPHLYTTCRTHYGSVLFATGRWAEAEEELRAALAIGTGAEPALRAEALATLAELRLARGRIEEAARLLAGYEDHPAAASAFGAVQLARGEPVPAAATLRRRLRGLDGRSLGAAGVLELLAEAELAQGRAEEAGALARRLADLGATTGCQLIAARGGRALGRTLIGTGRPADALPHLEGALAGFGRLEMPFEAGLTRLLLARALAGAGGQREAAIVEARGALAGFEALGAAPGADAAADFLRALGVKAARAGPEGGGPAHEARARGARRSWGRASPTPRSPGACSSAARRSSITSPACSPSSSSRAAARPPRTPSAPLIPAARASATR